MNFALVYLVRRALFRIADFFRHWYVDASRALSHRFISTLEAADQRIAFRVTLRHFFEPLYGDYSIVGRVLGLVFRSGRTLLGALCYAGIAAMYVILFAAWYAVPAALLFYALAEF
ncbi:MAG: hypothetical protein HYW65_00930 [Candidatus Liptonbacteria bacterium]|nr:hypothetical protein [Candidatus Liptonbacteria bacterium]